MKKYILVFLGIMCIFLLYCEKKPTRLIMEIGTPPQGGTNVTLVLVGVVGHLEDGDTPIKSVLELIWKENSVTDPIVIAGGDYTWENEEPEEFWIGLQAPPGYILVGRFWFRGCWFDEDSSYHEVYSDTVVCKIGYGSSAREKDLIIIKPEKID